jgi:hypothetical protein
MSESEPFAQLGWCCDEMKWYILRAAENAYNTETGQRFLSYSRVAGPEREIPESTLIKFCPWCGNPIEKD